MKKLLCGLLTSTMILSTLTASFATEFIETPTVYTQTLSAEGDFTINNTGVITKYTGNGGNVVIPTSIGGQTVTSIGAFAFQNMTNIESVTMPSSLRRIEESAFDGCINLRKVDLNQGLAYIGDKAFKNNTNLSSIWIPSTVTEIAYAAFCYAGLTSAYIPDTVKNVGTSLFYECTRLESAIFMADMDNLPEGTFIKCSVLDEVYLHEGIATIGTSAFERCTSLKNIVLPSTTEIIKQSAFLGCSKLEKLDFSNTKLTTVGYYAFQNCVSLTEAVFPYGFRNFTHGETSLDTDKGQFIGCSSLVKVVLPSTITSCFSRYTIPNYSIGAVLNALTGNYEILNHPFIDCNSSLVVYGYAETVVAQLATYTDVFSFSPLSNENQTPTISPTTAPTLPTKADFDVEIPQVSPEQSSNASAESDFVLGAGGMITNYTGIGGDVVIPSTISGNIVYGIGENAFQNKTNVTSVTLPSTAERIEELAFDGCTNLSSVNLNEGLYYIGARAFKNNRSLTSIWLPSTVTELDYAAFCFTGLTSAYIPATVKNVGTSLFYECTNLKSVIFMASIDTLPEGTLIKCSSLENVYLSEGIVSIGTSAFQDCISLKQITLPSTTKSIGQYGFYGCSKLEKLDFSNTQLSSVDFYAFQNCVSLTEAIFPYGFRTFAYGETSLDNDKGQFKGCTSLVKVVVPSTIGNCYYYNTFFNYSLLNQPFSDSNSALVVYGYPGTSVEQLASLTNTVTFSSLGSLSSENQGNVTPTTPPTLPTAPTITTPTVTPETSPEANPEVTTPSSPYPAWAANFIDFVSPTIMPDISVHNFDSDSTRGLIAECMYNMAGNGQIINNNPFSDAGIYENAISWCNEHGVMNGKSTATFGTNDTVTREEFALILQKASQSLDKTTQIGETSALNSYTDVYSISFWAKSGMAWAVSNNLMSGNNNQLNPSGNITRAEVAVMLYNFNSL